MRGIVVRSLHKVGYGGHEIDEAENGALALEHIRRTPPDLILADMNMPQLNGMDMLKTLRAEGWKPTVGFITSERADEVVSAAFAAGAAFFIIKPFTAEALKDALSRVLE
jgi:two-component system chemotaxis response regulator CheY